jgi:hypothetical protein
MTKFLLFHTMSIVILFYFYSIIFFSYSFAYFFFFPSYFLTYLFFYNISSCLPLSVILLAYLSDFTNVYHYLNTLWREQHKNNAETNYVSRCVVNYTVEDLREYIKSGNFHLVRRETNTTPAQSRWPSVTTHEAHQF